jgi:excisionase family DNA binding protein
MVRPSDAFIGVGELARRLGLTPGGIRVAIKAGRLEAVRIGRFYAIPRGAAAAYRPTQDFAEMGRRSGAARRPAQGRRAPGGATGGAGIRGRDG